MRRSRAVALLVVLAAATPVGAQDVDGYASIMFDAVPGQDAVESRTRVFAERRFDLGQRVRFTAAGFAEGLLASRGDHGVTTSGLLRPQEVHAELLWVHADLRIGWSRVVWGRLDEFLPTDVVNPLDFTRFFLDSRAEGRLPVAMVRARILPSDRFAVEAIYVPFFRRARFDQLDEDTSPFTLAPAVPVMSAEPARSLPNAQGGVRVTATLGRVDWSVSSYRGFEPLPVYEVEGLSLVERYPRYTMVGGDFETVWGELGLRGEAAVRQDRFEAGAGVDRRAGSYRVSTTVIVAHQDASAALPADTDTTIVASVDRSFARETRILRTFAVYNPADASVFARVIASISLRDNMTGELSGGVFAGSGNDALSQLRARDFLYARLKVFF